MLLGDLLDERTAIVDGYNSYFSFSRGRTGYSGNVCGLNELAQSGLIIKMHEVKNLFTVLVYNSLFYPLTCCICMYGGNWCLVFVACFYRTLSKQGSRHFVKTPLPHSLLKKD